MSSARNHAKRSHRSHHDMRANTGYSSRKAVIRSYNKPKPKQIFLTRLLSKLSRRGRDTEGKA